MCNLVEELEEPRGALTSPNPLVSSAWLGSRPGWPHGGRSVQKAPLREFRADIQHVLGSPPGRDGESSRARRRRSKCSRGCFSVQELLTAIDAEDACREDVARWPKRQLARSCSPNFGLPCSSCDWLARFESSPRGRRPYLLLRRRRTKTRDNVNP